METKKIHCSCEFLKSYITDNSINFHKLNVSLFRDWIQKQIIREKNNSSFQQRIIIRDLKKKHLGLYSKLQEELRKAEKAFNNHPNKEQLDKIEAGIDSSNKAIAGLKQFLEKNPSDEKRKEKLNQFEVKLKKLQDEHHNLSEEMLEKNLFESAKKEWEEFQKRIGLIDEEKKLALLLKQQGQRKSFAGGQYENVSLETVKNFILPTISNRHNIKQENLTILSNVTLGCARAEIDFLIVQKMPKKVVKVWGVVEVKKNINDIAGGFELRQENINWFSGMQEKYDPEMYRTKIFKKGHFDCEVTHEEHGELFLFSKNSFEELQKKEEYFLENLFFITNKRDLLGLRASESSVLSHRISTDIFFDITNDSYLEKLLSWSQEKFKKLQTLEVLSLYAKNDDYVKNFYIVEKSHKKDNDIQNELDKKQRQLLPLVIVPEENGFFPKKGDLVFSFDIQYVENEAYIAADVFYWEAEHIKTYVGLSKISVPYVSSYFCFREGPPLLALYQKIISNNNIPKLLIIDGHGVAHPRKFGAACWMGIATGVASIGCAKENLIHYDGDLLERKKGSLTPMVHDKENRGFVVRRIANVAPVFASGGHLVSNEDAAKITMQLSGEYKIPDTLRRADRAARDYSIKKPNKYEDLGLLPHATPLWDI